MSSLSANLDAVRTSLRQHIRSVPGSYRSSRLHRHLLFNEKERLEKEIMRLERRCFLCRQRMAEIEARLAGAPETRDRAEEVAPAQKAERAQERLIRMTIEY